MLAHPNATNSTVSETIYNPLPTLSPNSQSMLVTAYTNAENDYGYKVQLFDIDNNYIKDVSNNYNYLLSPIWLDDSNIAYIVHDSEYRIIKYDMANEVETELYSDSRALNKIASSNGAILFTMSDSAGDFSNSTLFKLENGRAIKIFAGKDGYANLVLSPEGDYAAYINNESILNIIDISKHDNISLNKVSYLIGWIQ